MVNERRRVLPPVYFLVTLLTMAALHYGVPVATLLSAPIKYLGAVPVLVGLVTVVWAAGCFCKKRDVDQAVRRIDASGNQGRIPRDPESDVSEHGVDSARGRDTFRYCQPSRADSILRIAYSTELHTIRGSSTGKNIWRYLSRLPE